MIKLKSLDEFNSEKYKQHYSMWHETIWNNIACPKCGAECFDSNPHATLTSNPPKKNIACSKCDFKGFRIA